MTDIYLIISLFYTQRRWHTSEFRCSLLSNKILCVQLNVTLRSRNNILQWKHKAFCVYCRGQYYCKQDNNIECCTGNASCSEFMSPPKVKLCDLQIKVPTKYEVFFPDRFPRSPHQIPQQIVHSLNVLELTRNFANTSRVCDAEVMCGF